MDQFSIILTRDLRTILAAFTHPSSVAVFDTFNSTRYEYKLSTIMVMDNLDRGRPVAFFISKNVDKENISLFFKVYFHFF